MVVIDGFWTGAIVGALVVIASLFVLSIYAHNKEIEARNNMINFMKNLDNAANIKVAEIKKGDLDNERND